MQHKPYINAMRALVLRLVFFRWHIWPAGAILLLLHGCAAQSAYEGRLAYRLIVSVADQRMLLLRGDRVEYAYAISTAKAGVGEAINSSATPRGLHEIAEKLGDGAAEGAVFQGRVLTGEIVAINSPGRHPVVTRILRLRGLEQHNETTFDRLIYLHGSPVEELLGQVASGGCIRMKSNEIIKLYALVSVGTHIDIVEQPLHMMSRL
jgi:hypothetical protein